MYKIDFEIKTILPWETRNTVIINLNIKEIYKKLNNSIRSDVINGHLRLALVRTDELSIRLSGFAFCMNINDLAEVHKKFKDILYKEFSIIDKNIKTEVLYLKVKTSNPFYFLFVMLRQKIKIAFSSLKQKLFML